MGTMTIKLGVLGLSEGNGHPYSWSAIFNGYNQEAMLLCGFPAIPEYLSERQFPRDSILGATVTHVWAEDIESAKKIALAANIENIVSSPEEMIGEIDALLLARDDAQNHLKFAQMFIESGLPVYIDKPFALSKNVAESIFSIERYPGQIFSCSALRFAKELMLSSQDRECIGEIRHVTGRVPKSWSKYIVHVIDPIIANLGPQGSVLDISKLSWEGRVMVNFRWESGVTCSLQSYGDLSAPIDLEFIGTKGCRRLVFSDSFSAFKSALIRFLEDSVNGNISHKKRIMDAVELIELGI
jgi:predicted dehydrogenase